MLLTNGLLKSLAVAALVFAWSAPALYSQTQNAPNAVNFGMIGLAPSQTLRLNISAWPPQPIYPPSPICIAQLSFANSSGAPVGPAKTVNLGAGQGDFLDLNGSALMVNPTPIYPPEPVRGEVRPVVTMLPSPGGGLRRAWPTSKSWIASAASASCSRPARLHGRQTQFSG